MPHKQKLSVEEKVRIVRAINQAEISISEAAQMSGCRRGTVEAWVRNYELDGIDAFLPHDNRVYPPEIKLQAVLDYLTGNEDSENICKKYHIRSKSQLKAWIKVYNNHGDFNSIKHSGGGSYMKQGRNTTQEERIEIAKECLESGRNYGKLAIKYNVSYQQVRTWTLRFEQLGEVGLEDRRGKRKKEQKPRTELEKAQIEIEQLKHKLYMTEMERDLLKKLNDVERRDAFRK